MAYALAGTASIAGNAGGCHGSMTSLMQQTAIPLENTLSIWFRLADITTGQKEWTHIKTRWGWTLTLIVEAPC